MKWTLAAVFCLAVAMAGQGAPSASNALVLAERGRGGATIVVPGKASESQCHAAEELQSYIAKCTGETLPIATDAEPLPRRAILLGVTRHTKKVLCMKRMSGTQELGSDGFRLVAAPPHLVVLSSPVRGTLYGVYELLEKHAGCRWYASWMEVAPKARLFAVPGDLDDTQRPAFAQREAFWWDAFNADFAARCRFNGPSNKVGAKQGGFAARFGKRMGRCHTLHSLVPPDEFFDAHPEYFSFRDGKRQRKGQHCLTNPDVLKIVVDRTLERIREDSEADYYGISQGDALVFHPNNCRCEKCVIVDNEEESFAGTMVRFVNAVAEAIEKEFQDKTIELLAYEYTRKPPKKTRLRHNVMPCVCTYECDFSVPLAESKWHEDAAFARDLAGWAAQAKELSVWDYTTDFACYPYPFPNVYALQGNLRFYRDSHVGSIFAQGAYQGDGAGLAEIKVWLLSKLMWNPDRDIKELLDDFFNGFYGAGAPFAREYFEELHRLEREYCQADPKRYLRCFHPIPSGHIPETFWDKADALLENAEAAVRGDAVREGNVRNLRFGVDYTRFLILRAKWQKDGEDAAIHWELVRLAKRMKPVVDSGRKIVLSEGAGKIAKEIRTLAAEKATEKETK